MEKLVFELELKEIPVELTGVDGEAKPYKLKELSGKQRDRFLNDMGKRMTFKGGEASSITNFEGLQGGLLALCLHDDEGALVSLEKIQEFPANVLTRLFEAAQKLSGLDVGAAEAAKNE